ncbi:DUF1405 domain-containing protein [Halobaculum sp. CBA1158]|uniref:DUF1405 domain-containing protein n=1 Tax=Halobaculum sp. CBA1158 TaxID=2904243 RepID=UPI001F2275B4|nr:DUF1405 domain-containing protein [Halobaculum sp. CBA1158]UIP01242.1 DUF1405 domain-containing protein [Halobaculum sp. CBA1158]
MVDRFCRSRTRELDRYWAYRDRDVDRVSDIDRDGTVDRDSIGPADADRTRFGPRPIKPRRVEAVVTVADEHETRNPVPAALAEFYLTTPFTLALLLLANALAFLVGVRYYVETMPAVATFAWPLYGDSPTAIALATLVLAALVPFAGYRLSAVPRSTLLSVLTTLAVVWLVKTGLWTFVALNVPFVRPELSNDLYVGFDADSLWAYWGILATHAAFLAEALLLARVGRTSGRTLAAAALLALANDLYDYGFLLGLPFANHPPVRYDPGWTLALGSLAATVVACAVAAAVLPWGDSASR